MPKTHIEVLMVGSSERFWELRKNIIMADLIAGQASWSMSCGYTLTYPRAISVVTSQPTLDLVFIYNDLGLSQKGVLKFCKQLTEVLAVHPNKPAVGLDLHVIVGEEEELFAKLFRERGVEVLSGDIGDIVTTYMRSKTDRNLN
jgi:hypothetical protein